MSDRPRDALEAHAAPLAAYVERLHAHDHPVLRRLEARAAREGFPIVGPSVGRLIAQVVTVQRPARIFELGSGFGYSALWAGLAAAACGLDVRIVLTEGDPRLLDDAHEALTEAGVRERCELRQGEAIALLEADPEPVDLFFVDIDKERYGDTLEPMMARLRPGGSILVDNMLWYGRVVAPANDAATAGVLDLTRRLMAHPELCTCLLPVRDGVTWSVRAPSIVSNA